MTMSSMYSKGLQSHQVSIQVLHIMDVQPTNLQQLCDAENMNRTPIGVENLIEAMT